MELAHLRRLPARRALVRRRARYELLKAGAPPVEMWSWDLDQALYGRRYPADFWVVVKEADRAFTEGGASWIAFPSGHRVAEPGHR
jgi:hypothetical protein